MDRTLHYRGDLRQTALPEMLTIIQRTRVAGVIEAVAGEITKRVFLRDGYVVHASSSDLVDSLGGYLRRVGRLSEGQFVSAMKRREEAGRRLGEILVEDGILSPAQVYQAIREHVEGIVWSLFSWEEGEVSFRLGDLDDPEVVRIQIPLRQVIVQGVKRSANAKSVVHRMGGKETLLEPAYRFEDLIEVALDEKEFRLLRSVDGRKSLYELCTQGPFTPPDNARLLYAFSVLGLLKKSTTVETSSAGGIKIKLRSDA